MTYEYFNMAGLPARIKLDEEGLACYSEIYSRRSGGFVRENRILDDLYNSYDSTPISEEQFNALVFRVSKSAEQV